MQQPFAPRGMVWQAGQEARYNVNIGFGEGVTDFFGRRIFPYMGVIDLIEWEGAANNGYLIAEIENIDYCSAYRFANLGSNSDFKFEYSWT